MVSMRTEAVATDVKLNTAAPIFLVRDISETMHWYHDHLGFQPFPFPNSGPPYVFCILFRDGVEIMLQRNAEYVRPDEHSVPGGFRKSDTGLDRWDAYIRMTGIRELYEDLSNNPAVEIVEHLHKQSYGDGEFVIRDPNGYLLIFSELIPAS
jgi:catechol 2,3-dioxygenase-like lactoylglutathione lyase family enzyme